MVGVNTISLTFYFKNGSGKYLINFLRKLFNNVSSALFYIVEK